MNNKKRSAALTRALTVSEEKKLFACVRRFGDVLSRRDCAVMMLARQTGPRVGSLVGLTVDDAQEALRTGRINFRPEHAKGGRGYSVFVNKKARKALTELLKIRKEMGADPDGPLIVGRRGRGLSIRSLQDRVARWGREAGIRELTPHCFRHTLGTRIVQESTAREPLRVAQLALGHATISSTAIYAAPSPDEVDQSLEEAS